MGPQSWLETHPESPACGWETDGGRWAIKTFRYPYTCEAGTELERCQRQADEVTEIMLNNFDKVLERDGKLAELEQRSDQLLDMSSAFSKTTKTLAQQKRWENMRCRIYLGLVLGGCLLILLIVLLVIFLPQSSGGSSATQAQDTGAASGPGD
ncbi:vesicle-associated membrane protein 5 [Mustela lutreola]|uniref:Vesicle-associated membrane protein 5 n=1 Tax=Mustela putorius furo TaxID=9669 RepID=A0A8U0V034_MUSPF|nr:vesicle-associated membrane protein 5 [Mustela putorius furo]XP_059044244.1 vesicle-associated membrane protein 5 [Mustela lutreola]